MVLRPAWDTIGGELGPALATIGREVGLAWATGSKVEDIAHQANACCAFVCTDPFSVYEIDSSVPLHPQY